MLLISCLVCSLLCDDGDGSERSVHTMFQETVWVTRRSSLEFTLKRVFFVVEFRSSLVLTSAAWNTSTKKGLRGLKHTSFFKYSMLLNESI